LEEVQAYKVRWATTGTWNANLCWDPLLARLLPMEGSAVICPRVRLSARVQSLGLMSCRLLMRRLEVSLWSPVGFARQ